MTTSSWRTASAPTPVADGDQAIAGAGAFDEHFSHMRTRSGERSWTRSPRLELPDPALVDAYKSGFIRRRSRGAANPSIPGVNGYESEFSHDVVGILTNLFTQGYFTDAHALSPRPAPWWATRASTSTACGPTPCPGPSTS